MPTWNAQARPVVSRWAPKRTASGVPRLAACRPRALTWKTATPVRRLKSKQHQQTLTRSRLVFIGLRPPGRRVTLLRFRPTWAAPAVRLRQRSINRLCPTTPGPSYAASPNYAAVTYPKQYSPTAWPFIGPFYPYPQVPLGWRKVALEWDDGWWFLDFYDRSHH